MLISKKFIYQSEDEKYGLEIDKDSINRILEYCQKASPKETGGIVIGYYSVDSKWAIITDITGPPKDSVCKNRYFYRGIKGLQKLLDLKWEKRKSYYLGEWHFHPNYLAESSRIDNIQMMHFANDRLLNCPEPLLLIVGGDPKRKWEIKAYVFVGETKKELL